MLLEIVVLGVVLYVLTVLHKQDIAKGGEGVPVIGEFLEEIDERVRKFLADNKRKKNLKKTNDSTAKSSSQEQSDQSGSSAGEETKKTSAENPTQLNAIPLEKFESVRPVKNPSKNDKSKHHHQRHRSKLESALVAAQRDSEERSK